MEAASVSTTESGTSGTSSGSDKESPPPPEKKQKSSPPLSAVSESRGGGGKLTKKKSRCAQETITNGALASRPVPVGAVKPKVSEGETDKMLEMAASRKVYKSLFSSNASERPKEQTSNWVTFFPYH